MPEHKEQTDKIRKEVCKKCGGKGWMKWLDIYNVKVTCNECKGSGQNDNSKIY